MIPFRLIVITDWSVPDCAARVLAVSRACGDAVAIQHRHPGASDRAFYEEGLRLKGVPFLFVNRRVDIALALEAHVHLTERSIPVETARSIIGRDRLISASWHRDTVQRAGADLFLLSPVFIEKDRRAPLGLAGFQSLASNDVFALGGITPANATGLRRAAVIGSVMHAEDPVAAAKALLAALS